MRRAFFRIGKLGNDRQARKRADGVHCEQHFFNVGKGLQDVEIDAALFERHCLLVKNVQDLFVVRMTGLHAEPERPDGARDQHFARGGFAGFASDFHAANPLTWWAIGCSFQAPKTPCCKSCAGRKCLAGARSSSARPR